MVIKIEALLFKVLFRELVGMDWISIILEELLISVVIFLLVVDLKLCFRTIITLNKELLLVCILLLNLLSHLISAAHALTKSFPNLS